MIKTIPLLIATFILFDIIKTERLLTKYKGVMEQISPCENNLKLESPFKNFKFVRLNRTHKIATAEITFKRDLDENIATKSTIEKSVNGNWKEIPGLPQQNNVCKTFALFMKDSWTRLMESFTMESPEKCPQPAGTYQFRSYANTFDSSSMPLFEGKYRMKQMFLTNDGNTIISCIKTIMDIRPQ